MSYKDESAQTVAFNILKQVGHHLKMFLRLDSEIYDYFMYCNDFSTALQANPLREVLGKKILNYIMRCSSENVNLWSQINSHVLVRPFASSNQTQNNTNYCSSI